MIITVDVALYNVECQLTTACKLQIEDFLSKRWKCDVKIGATQVVAFDLESTKDPEHDYAINNRNIKSVLAGFNVLIIGTNGLPLHALRPLVDAMQELDVRMIPMEVFAVVQDREKKFQRFSHMSLYKRNVNL